MPEGIIHRLAFSPAASSSDGGKAKTFVRKRLAGLFEVSAKAIYGEPCQDAQEK